MTDLDERAAQAAYDQWVMFGQKGTSRYPFMAAWQARAGYDQARVAQLVEALARHIDATGHTSGCCANGICECSTTCKMTRAALALAQPEPSAAEEEQVACTRCGDQITDGYMIGDGNGGGNRFAHPECYRQYPGAYKLRESIR